MQSLRKSAAIAWTALSALVLAFLLLTPSGSAHAGVPDLEELPALKEAPDIPVGSIILRRALPGHPAPPVAEDGLPALDAPGLEGRREPATGGCDKDVDLSGNIGGLTPIAAQNNIICTNADIDTYTNAFDRIYVVQAGGEEAAWTLTDVTDPANPVLVRQWVWSGGSGKNTYTPDVKAFRQGGKDYIVMGLERMKVRAYCGVVIVDVTDPVNSVIMSQYIGADWCDTHNVFVEKDPDNGDGIYIYATADGPNDLRVLDISGANQCVNPQSNALESSSVTNPCEIGRYRAPTASNDNYVHDVTVVDHGPGVGRRVYLAYWDTGLVVLNAADVTPGTNPTPIIGPNDLDPAGFLNHHSFPTQDGNFVFIQDEFLGASGDAPVQMWDISTPATPTLVDSLVLGTDVAANPAHNLEIRYDLDPNRLYVAWYKLGLQAWDFDDFGFLPASSTARAAVHHQVQTEAGDEAYSGAWGVRLEEIIVGASTFLYLFQSDRNYGLVVSCEGCTPPATGTVTGQITDSSTNQPIDGASVEADTGQITTTDANGNYTLNDVPVGTRTVTASKTGYLDNQATGVSVTDGATTAGVDIALDPEPAGGGFGNIKGTISSSTGGKLGGVLVITDNGQSATTNNGGKYNIGNVPEGSRTVTASRSGYVTLDQPATVSAGLTTTVDFTLVPD